LAGGVAQHPFKLEYIGLLRQLTFTPSGDSVKLVPVILVAMFLVVVVSARWTWRSLARGFLFDGCKETPRVSVGFQDSILERLL